MKHKSINLKKKQKLGDPKNLWQNPPKTTHFFILFFRSWLPSCKLTVRHGKSTILMVFTRKGGDFHGRNVSFREGIPKTPWKFFVQLPPPPLWIVAPLVCLTRHRGTSAKMPASNGWVGKCDFRLKKWSNMSVQKFFVLHSTKKGRDAINISAWFFASFISLEPPFKEVLPVFSWFFIQENPTENINTSESTPSKRSSVCAPWKALGPEGEGPKNSPKFSGNPILLGGSGPR